MKEERLSLKEVTPGRVGMVECYATITSLWFNKDTFKACSSGGFGRQFLSRLVMHNIEIGP
jgi:hypothetical protein